MTTTEYNYIYQWGSDANTVARWRQRWKGKPCKLLSCGKMNTVKIQFMDGEILVTSRNAIRLRNGNDRM